ncbi:MAG: type II toxin-antitoxin system VapC family toxin [Solirubrobacteraceae bacterium]
MLVVDASCLVAALIGGPEAEPVRARLAGEPDQAAPHLIDAEVLSVIGRELAHDELDLTGATQAVDEMAHWPGERVGHRLLLARAFELRDTVRVPDALYVALAEALGVPLLTLDRQLAAAPGPACTIELL